MNDLLLQHPTNLGLNLGNVSSTNKKWTERYHGITVRQLKLHTTYVNGVFAYADWTPLVELCSDENLRRREPSYPPNPRAVWLLGAEENVKQYYVVELSSVVLSKFVRFPEVNSQGDIPKLRGNGGNRVDIIYHWGNRELVIGDFKRNTFRAKSWMDGKFEKKADQQRLARELRG